MKQSNVFPIVIIMILSMTSSQSLIDLARDEN